MTNDIPELPLDRVEIKPFPFIFDNRPPWNWKTAQRDHYNLWICMKGSGIMECDGSDYTIAPWTAFVLPPDVSISASTITPDGKLLNFAIHWLPMNDPTRFREARLYGIALREISIVQEIITSMVRLSVFDDPLARQQLEWMLLMMLALIWRDAQTPHASVIDTKIYRQIERIRSGQDLFASVEDLASEVHLSKMHYTRCFRALTGESPNHFLIQQRIERACLLLRTTDWPLETIADAIGYSDVYFFSRQFKRMILCTPRQFRDAHTP